jgi:hypothetical protein
LGFLFFVHEEHVRGMVGMQAAEFMGCTDSQADILNHLKTLLNDTMERAEKIGESLDSFLSVAAKHAYTRDWHNIQVCECACVRARARVRTGLCVHANVSE